MFVNPKRVAMNQTKHVGVRGRRRASAPVGCGLWVSSAALVRERKRERERERESARRASFFAPRPEMRRLRVPDITWQGAKAIRAAALSSANLQCGRNGGSGRPTSLSGGTRRDRSRNSRSTSRPWRWRCSSSAPFGCRSWKTPSGPGRSRGSRAGSSRRATCACA